RSGHAGERYLSSRRCRLPCGAGAFGRPVPADVPSGNGPSSRSLAIALTAMRSSGSKKRTSLRQPLFWAALAYSLGILTGAYAWRPPAWWVLAILVFLASGCYLLRHRLLPAKAVALAAWLFLGAISVQLRPPPRLPTEDLSGFMDGREVIVTGHVTREGEIREATFAG